MNRVYVTNDQEKFPVGASLRGLIKRAIGAALKFEGFRYDAEVSVTLTDNCKIRGLNYDYRDVDRETDVLSFPLYENGEIDESEIVEGEPVGLGDIVISLEKADEQAKAYGHSFDREIAFLCVHSVLHLLGYDHELGKEQENDMFERQEKILQKMGITREK